MKRTGEIFCNAKQMKWEDLGEGASRKIMGWDNQIIEEGDGLYIPPNILHGVLCLEEEILIDVFSPVREDFL